MATKRITTRVLAGLTLVSGLAGGRAAAQTPETLLARQPVQPGVQVTTPAGPELAACKAEAMSWPKGPNGTPTGVVVKDATGKLVRQFVDTTGRNNPNIFSFYLNGTETYREMDLNGDGKPDRFRWLGVNGSKFGDDKNGDGVVDQWYVLSPEELSQELFQVLISKDPKKLTPLIPTQDELKAAGFPDAEIAKIMQRTAGIGNKVGATIQALNLAATAKWVHVEVGVPQTTPGDAVGSPTDIVVHKNVTVLFDKGDGKSADVFQTGELVLVGKAWRLIDGPAPGAAPVGGPDEAGGLPPDFQPLLTELQATKTPAERATVLEKITGKLQGAQQEPWLKQMIEAYATAAETGDAAALGRLKQWHDVVVKAAPGSANAGFVAFRLLNVEYTVKLAATEPKPDVAKIQTWWRESLEAFLKAYPAAEDAPEAMIRLAVAFEFAGKDSDARGWYEKLATSFPKDALAAKAKGAVDRLNSEGQPFKLAGGKLGGGQFDMGAVAGKAVVVYYWASWGREAVAELKMLAELAKTFGPKGLEVVTVNLDTEPGKAAATLTEAGAMGAAGFHHLFAPGGLDGSPLAAAYGIQMAPHVFLVGKDGKVVSKNAQTGVVLKDEVEKLVR